MDQLTADEVILEFGHRLRAGSEDLEVISVLPREVIILVKTIAEAFTRDQRDRAPERFPTKEAERAHTVGIALGALVILDVIVGHFQAESDPPPLKAA